jgi:ribosome-binding factor A
MRNAIIFFTAADGIKKDVALRFFEVQKYYLRSLIAKQIKLKFVPNISFKIDTSVENAEKIDIFLKRL